MHLSFNLLLTSATVQVRTSYLPSEIMWGHRLFPLTACSSTGGKYTVDYTHFNDVVSIMMPHCSARDYYERFVGSAQDVIKPNNAPKTDISFRHLAEIRQQRMDKERHAEITKL
jgi:hypothetical protein